MDGGRKSRHQKTSPLSLSLSNPVQGGQAGRGIQFVEIKLKALLQNELLITLKRNSDFNV